MPYLRWDDHSAHVMSLVRKLYKNLELADCTLDTKGGLICCHKTILVACSPYLKKLMEDHHGMKIIPFKEVKYNEMKLILDFVYFGEVDVSLSDVSSFMQTARLLQIPTLCDSPAIFSEKSSVNVFCDGNDVDSGTKCTVNLTKYDDSDTSVQGTKIICNEDFCRENEVGLNVNYKNIGNSKTQRENDLEGVPQPSKEIHLKNNNENSSVINVDMINKGTESYRDTLAPFSFVAVSPFSVKSELGDDDLNALDEENPLEENGENDDAAKEIKWERDLQLESVVKEEMKEEDNVCESDDACDPMEMVSISHETDDNMLKNTENICGKESSQDVPLLESVHCGSSKRCVPEEMKDLRMEFESICDISKCEWSEEKPLETDSINEANDQSMSNESSTSIINVNEASVASKSERLRIGDSPLVSERIDSSSEMKLDHNHSAFMESSRLSRTCTQPTSREKTLETRSKENLDCIQSDSFSYDMKCDDLEPLEEGHSVYSTESSESVFIQTEEQRFLCNICNSSFGRKHELMLHIRTHSDDTPFMCDICGSSFSQNSNLKTHKRIHSGIKPYKCHVCGATFSRSSYLRAHRDVHTGIKPFKCDICGVAFSRNGNLKKHKLIHSGIKPFKCDICGVTFSQSGSLNRHMLAHTGDKPYKCDICGTTFNQNASLKKHMLVHNRIKPFKCDVCGATFSRNGTLKRHMLVHT